MGKFKSLLCANACRCPSWNLAKVGSEFCACVRLLAERPSSKTLGAFTRFLNLAAVSQTPPPSVLQGFNSIKGCPFSMKVRRKGQVTIISMLLIRDILDGSLQFNEHLHANVLPNLHLLLTSVYRSSNSST